jgi:hypothetical protein
MFQGFMTQSICASSTAFLENGHKERRKVMGKLVSVAPLGLKCGTHKIFETDKMNALSIVYE